MEQADNQAQVELSSGAQPRPRPAVPWLMWMGVCMAALALSVLLQPDPRGYGTHEQFSHVPCTFRLMTHLPCPLCGMSTSFAYMSRGLLWDAFRSSPFGPLLWALTVLSIPYSVWRAAGGRSFLPPGLLDAVLRPGTFLPLLGVIWVARLVAFFVWRQ